ncbi:MAG: sporulation protein, partial [Chthonomonadaceae bacterium]|nr:sporulation protein [Chthonomonadaceae bacterium]
MFNKFLASIGIDSALLTLKLNSEYFSRGGILEGMIKLQGGVVKQRIEKITVKLAKLHQTGESSYWKTLSEVYVMETIDILPREIQEKSFSLPIPNDTPITKSNYATKLVKIMAVADILWAVNPRAHLNVKIVPESEILVLDVALRELGFAEMRDDFSAEMLTSDSMVKRIYDAPTALEDQITRAVLEVSVSGKHVRGHLALHRRAVHFTDYL